MISHIIPSFVGKWLKGSSPTGFLRKPSNPNKRVQDLEKTRLLCAECEQRLSRVESSFAANMFHPYLTGKAWRFDYGPWLLKFAVSLSWRTTIATLAAPDVEPIPKRQLGQVDKARLVWEDFLLDKSADVAPYEQHVFLRIQEMSTFLRSFSGTQCGVAMPLWPRASTKSSRTRNFRGFSFGRPFIQRRQPTGMERKLWPAEAILAHRRIFPKPGSRTSSPVGFARQTRQ